MINHIITKDKTMFDLFNMIQPNCYQAYIIQCIIEDRKQDAISYCNELQTAVDYYKWNVHNNTTDYTDCLICNSELEQWQKIALLHIVSNDYNKCKYTIELEIAKLERMNSTKFDCVNRCMNDNNIVIDDHKINHKNSIKSDDDCNHQKRPSISYDDIYDLLWL